jgi:transposase
MNTECTIIGIDISKDSFDVCLLRNGKEKYRKFSNNKQGFSKLDALLRTEGLEVVHCCMESTGRLFEPLANHLNNAGHKVSVVNPRQIKGFAISELKRSKNDKADAGIIARFCRSNSPSVWKPQPQEIRDLQEATRYLECLKANIRQELNRLDSGLMCSIVAGEIEEHVKFMRSKIEKLEAWIKSHIKQYERLNKQYKLITSIIGVGDRTASTYLAELGYSDNFRLTRQVESFCGLTSRQHTSGTSVKARERLSKVGNSHIRKALYMPAMTAMQNNPIIREFADRLRRAGKPAKVIVCASMRKLLRMIYAVVTSGMPFDPDYRPVVVLL